MQTAIARTPEGSGRIARATDGQIALVLAAALFVVGAWPLALVRVPPLQDLPNHLATASVLAHPDRYPEFVFNGYFKTNSALFVWLSAVGPAVGLAAAGRLFTLLVIALGALGYPLFLWSFGGRARMLVGSAFAWPLVHDWFVCMGMLDFALSFALSLLLLVLLNELRKRPRVPVAVGAFVLGCLVWYAHVFPLLVVLLLVAVHLLATRAWRRPPDAGWLVAPLVVPACLAAMSILAQVTEPRGAMAGYVALGKFLPPWELLYNLWAEWFWAFTWREYATLVPCALLAFWAVRRARDDVPFFGPWALAALAALYAFTPYTAGNWFHVNSRFIPFLWLAAMVRLPDRVPRALLLTLGACAATYAVGMGVDYVRIASDWDRFAAGVSVVPEGARLLPLLFGSKGRSENTHAMLHAWGFYVLERHTSAPLLFAHSRSFAVMYREPPPVQFNHLVLEAFAPAMGTPEWLCGTLRSGGVSLDEDCEGAWEKRWRVFWAEAEERFDWILLWDAPEDVMRIVPAEYRVVMKEGELTVLGKRRGSGG
jgi:hypothetical protein